MWHRANKAQYMVGSSVESRRALLNLDKETQTKSGLRDIANVERNECLSKVMRNVTRKCLSAK